MFNFLKDIIAPKKCYSCQEEWHFLCPVCLWKLQMYGRVFPLYKGKSNNRHSVYYDEVFICYDYEEEFIARSIKQSKFYSKKDVLYEMIPIMNSVLPDNYINKTEIICLWVPMTFLKKCKRWYNQSEILAQGIAKIRTLPYYKNLISKKRTTRQQSHLNRQQRQINLKDSFQINKKYTDTVDKKHIIIVDDVFSTWSTLNELSKILKHHGAKKITWLMFATKKRWK